MKILNTLLFSNLYQSFNANLKSPSTYLTKLNYMKEFSPNNIRNGTEIVAFIDNYYDESQNSEYNVLKTIDLKTNSVKHHLKFVNTTISNLQWLAENVVLFVYDGKICKFDITNSELYDSILHKDDIYKDIYLELNKNSIISTFKINFNKNILVFSSFIKFRDLEKKFYDSALIYDQLFIKHKDHFIERGRSHLYSVKFNPNDYSISEAPIDLFKKYYFECPVESLGSYLDYNISPDGEYTAFCSKKPGKDQAWQTQQNIYLIKNDGNELISDITENNQGLTTRPIFSPNGKYLSWLEMETPKYDTDKNEIVVYDLKTKSKKYISKDWKLSSSGNLFSPDSKNIFTTAVEKGNKKLFKICIETSEIEKLSDNHTIINLNLMNNEKLLFNVNSFDFPNEIYSLNIESNKIKKHSSINNDKLNKDTTSSYEEFWYKGASNDEIHGVIFKPKYTNLNKLLVILNKNQHGYWSDSFITNNNFNVYSNAGFTVVSFNVHGSVGYGQNFTDSVNQNFVDYQIEDIEKGVEFVKQKYMDSNKINTCGLGTGFGGYLINLFNSKQNNPFDCLITINGIFDLKSFYYSTDELFSLEYNFNNILPFDDDTLYTKYSPSTYVKNFKIPTLVIQGGLDSQYLNTQSISTFTALQRMGVRSRFMYFPDESDQIIKSSNINRFTDEIIKWVKAF